MVSIGRQLFLNAHFTIAPTADGYCQTEITAGAASRGKAAARWFPTKAQEVVTPSNVEALWVRHILLQTRSLADEIFQLLKRGERDFDDIARTLSDCAETRNSGGEIGWVGVESGHLDEIMDLSAREYLLGHCKPGDIVVHETERGVHVVMVEDVMMKLQYSVRKPMRRLRGFGRQIIHSALVPPRHDGSTGKTNFVNEIHKKYFVET